MRVHIAELCMRLHMGRSRRVISEMPHFRWCVSPLTAPFGTRIGSEIRVIPGGGVFSSVMLSVTHRMGRPFGRG